MGLVTNYFYPSTDNSKKKQERILPRQIFIQHFFKIVLYWCLDLICHNIGTPLKHDKYNIVDISIPFCHLIIFTYLQLLGNVSQNFIIS